MTTRVSISKIEIRKRQRTAMSSQKLHDLVESIRMRGLLNPPVCWRDEKTDTWVLVAGERRYRAICTIHADTNPDDRYFQHSLEVYDNADLPITPLGDYLDQIGRFEAELDENVQRENLSWEDETRALAEIHAIRKLAAPDQTFTDTAAELSAKSGSSVSNQAAKVSAAVALAPHLHNEKIANARNATEALNLVYKMEEEKLRAALLKRTLAASPTKAALEVRLADLYVELPKLLSTTYDLIIADPPYGIGASGPGFRQRAVHHHNYADTVDEAKLIAKTILAEGFRVTKIGANLFMFHDIQLFNWLKDMAANLGWVPFPRPLIWMKSESEGLAPWGGMGPRITTEFILFATKGQRGMNTTPVDVFNIKRVPRHERLHAAEKPVELLRRLIEITTLPGDSVLDPCCGSGSTLVAVREAGRVGLGLEKDPDYYNTALVNVHGLKNGTTQLPVQPADQPAQPAPISDDEL